MLNASVCFSRSWTQLNRSWSNFRRRRQVAREKRVKSDKRQWRKRDARIPNNAQYNRAAIQ